MTIRVSNTSTLLRSCFGDRLVSVVHGDQVTVTTPIDGTFRGRLLYSNSSRVFYRVVGINGEHTLIMDRDVDITSGETIFVSFIMSDILAPVEGEGEVYRFEQRLVVDGFLYIGTSSVYFVGCEFVVESRGVLVVGYTNWDEAGDIPTSLDKPRIYIQSDTYSEEFDSVCQKGGYMSLSGCVLTVSNTNRNDLGFHPGSTIQMLNTRIDTQNNLSNCVLASADLYLHNVTFENLYGVTLSSIPRKAYGVSILDCSAGLSYTFIGSNMPCATLDELRIVGADSYTIQRAAYSGLILLDPLFDTTVMSTSGRCEVRIDRTFTDHLIGFDPNNLKDSVCYYFGSPIPVRSMSRSFLSFHSRIRHTHLTVGDKICFMMYANPLERYERPERFYTIRDVTNMQKIQLDANISSRITGSSTPYYVFRVQERVPTALGVIPACSSTVEYIAYDETHFVQGDVGCRVVHYDDKTFKGPINPSGEGIYIEGADERLTKEEEPDGGGGVESGGEDTKQTEGGGGGLDTLEGGEETKQREEQTTTTLEGEDEITAGGGRETSTGGDGETTEGGGGETTEGGGAEPTTVGDDETKTGGDETLTGGDETTEGGGNNRGWRWRNISRRR